MSVERIKISDLNLIRIDEDIPGNFTSVRGEYEIPQIGKTGFFKVNDCMNGAREDEDLRELFASKILDKIDFPHAEILLARDDKKDRNGCLSVNILKENEEFVGLDSESRGRLSIKEFIEDNLRMTSEIPGITKEDLKARKEYLIKYLFASALISNSDLKTDNFHMIQNKETGKFRSPEYYDMGVAFVDKGPRKLLDRFTANELIEQLYEQYPDEIKLMCKKVQKNLNIDIIDELLNEEEFQEFPEETQIEIHSQMMDRLELIEKLNTKEQNKYNIGKPGSSENIEPEELSLAISEWSEGNPKLEEAITSCIQNGIPTYASCKGHNLFDRPYLSMIITKDNLGKILNIMNEINSMRNTSIMISYNRADYTQRKPLSTLTIYSNMLNRNRIFSRIATAANSEIELDECSEIVQNLWNFHKSTRIADCFGLCNDTYYNRKRIEITPINDGFNLDYILQKQGIKSKKIYSNGKIFYKKRGINDTLKELTGVFERTYRRNKNDEFFEDKEESEKENPFKEKLKATLDELDPSKDKVEKQISNEQSKADKGIKALQDDENVIE